MALLRSIRELIRLICRLGRSWVVLPGLVLLLAGNPCLAQSPPAREYQLKAVFLFNFAQFVAWPANRFSSNTSPIVIGVLGKDPFGSYLDEVIKGERVNGRSLVIRRFENIEEASQCHILYIGNSEKDHYEQIFERLKGKGILTVGEMEGFSLKGGMIRFAPEGSKIRLHINNQAAREDGLTISSKLLRAAAKVTSTSKG